MKNYKLIVILIVVGILTSVMFGGCSPTTTTLTTTATLITTETVTKTPAPATTVTLTVNSIPTNTSVSGASGTAAIITAADAWLSSGNEYNITAQELYDNLSNGDLMDDPFTICVDDLELYVKGHIPGSINIYWRDVFKNDNLAKLPINKQIVIYSNIGDTASQVVALLNALGYNAVNLKWGMVSWTSNNDLTPERWDPLIDCMNFLSMPGNDPGSVAEATQCG